MKKVLFFLLIPVLAIVMAFAWNTPPHSWNMGIALYSFNKFPLPVAIQKADSAKVKFVEGFVYHELGEGFSHKTLGEMDEADTRKLKKLLDSKGITMTSMYVGGAKDVYGWKAFFETGKILGMKYLVCEPERREWDMIDSLAGIYKIKIALHEHPKGASAYWHPDSVLVAMKGHPNFGACADIGHWERSGLNPAECLKKLSGHVLGLHIKDIDESGNTKANDVVVGKGVIDYNAVVKELQAQHFKGYAHVECEHAWDNNLPAVKEAIRYINSIK